MFDVNISEKFYCHFDGEEVQLKEMFDPDIMKLLDENNLIMGKVPGGSTNLTQACDAKHVILAVKSANKFINDSDVKCQTMLLGKLTAMFVEHNIWLNSNGRNSNIKSKGRKKGNSNVIEMSPIHVRLAKFGLLRVQMAIQNSLIPRRIRESFKCIGLYPYSHERTMANCRTKLTVEQMKIIEGKRNNLMNELELHGEISDEIMHDEFLLPAFEGYTSKSNNVLNRKRAVNCCHPAVREKRTKYIDDREAAKDKTRGNKRKKALKQKGITNYTKVGNFILTTKQ